jgi:hypothetical protein
MKMNLTKWSLSIVGAVALAGPTQAADQLLVYGSRQPTKVTIEGTSTIHDWKVIGNIVIGSFEVEPAFQSDKSLKSVASLLGEGKCPRVQVSIPVRSLHSTVAIAADTMDAIMQEAMRMTDNPKIIYRLTAMAVHGAVPEAGTPVKLDTTGDLAVSGVTNKIEMQVTMERLDNDQLKFTGSKVLKMTSFKIQPPSPKLSGGMIKTGDEVTVTFEWLVGLKKPE